MVTPLQDLWIQAECLVQVEKGALEVASSQLRRASICIAGNVCRIQPNGLTIIRLAAQLKACEAPTSMHIGVLRVELDGLAEVFQRALMIP